MSDDDQLRTWIEQEALALDEALRSDRLRSRATRRGARSALMAAWLAAESGGRVAMAEALRRLITQGRRLSGHAPLRWSAMRVRRPVERGVRLPAADGARLRWLAGHTGRCSPLQVVTERRLRWFEERAARHAPTLVRPIAAATERSGGHLAGELELIRKRGRPRRR
jgi:hypothetical protein